MDCGEGDDNAYGSRSRFGGAAEVRLPPIPAAHDTEASVLHQHINHPLRHTHRSDYMLTSNGIELWMLKLSLMDVKMTFFDSLEHGVSVSTCRIRRKDQPGNHNLVGANCQSSYPVKHRAGLFSIFPRFG